MKSMISRAQTALRLLLACSIGSLLLFCNPVASESGCWTSWQDTDDPTGEGDFESLANLVKANREVCKRPTGIRCRTKTNHVDALKTGQKLVCGQAGLICRNDEQKNSSCFDYEVSFLCQCRTRHFCGSAIDTRVVPYGRVSIDEIVTDRRIIKCDWLLRAAKGERLRFLTTTTSLTSGSRCHVYDSKSQLNTWEAMWSKGVRGYSASHLVSTGNVLRFTCYIKSYFARRYGSNLRFWYSTVPKPIQWKKCNFEADTCRWGIGRSDWQRVICPQSDDYNGTMSHTESGLACQSWNAQYPHRHSFTDVEAYPELAAARNYCRNPGNVLSGPWCYTLDSRTVRELCPIGATMCEEGKSSYLALIKRSTQPAQLSESTSSPLAEFKSSGTVLFSPLFRAVKFKCFKFNYIFKPNETQRATLSVSFVDKKGETLLTRKYFGTGTRNWHPALIKIPHNVEVYVRIQADGLETDNWKTGDVAIDNIAVTSCSESIKCAFGNESCVIRSFGKWSKQNGTVQTLPPKSSERNPAGCLLKSSQERDSVTQDAIYSFVLPEGSTPSRRSFLSFILTPNYRRSSSQCVMLTYKTSFADSRATVSNLTRKPTASRSYVAWQRDTVSSSRWHTDLFLLPDSASSRQAPIVADLMAQKIRLYPHYDVPAKGGFFNLLSLQIIFPCGKARSCTSFSYADSKCGWDTKHTPPTNFFQWSVIDPGVLLFSPGWSSPSRSVVEFIQSPPVAAEDGYKCFAVQYYAYASLLERYSWSYRIQLIVDGEVCRDRKLKSVAQSGKWHMDVVAIPNFDTSIRFAQIRLELCEKCRIEFKNFVFSKKSCRTDAGNLNDVNECASNPCSQVCTNTFEGYECSCHDTHRYKLAADNHSCIPQCTPACQNGGKCVSYNHCRCPDRYFGRDCSLYCGAPILKNLSGIIDVYRPASFNIPQKNGLFCSWTIQAPLGRTIAFEVTKFSTRDNCAYETVTVDSNATDNTVVSCNNHNRDTVVVSKSNQLTISYHFKYSWYYPEDHFQARYRIQESGCVSKCSQAEWWQKCCHNFVITSPNVFRQGSVAEIHLVTQGINALSSFEARLLREGDVVLTSKHGFFQLIEGYGFVSFEIPEDFLPGKYLLEVGGVGAANESSLEGTAEVGIGAKGPSVLVQTDKPVYKPGQLVRMRLVILDFTMKPYNGNISVEVADGRGTKILQWLNLIPNNGVANLSFSLSSQPVAGTWKIFVYTKPSWKETLVLVQEACFTVQEYVLPKFQVDVLLPQYLIRDDPYLTGTVSARYTYGKNVKGRACLQITSLHQLYFRDTPSRLTYCVQIDGLADFSVETYDLVGKWFSSYYRFSPDYYAPHALEVNVTVTEQGTKSAVNASQIVTVARDPFTLRFVPGTPTFYKPGLPFKATISIVAPDLRPFLNTTTIHVKIDGDGKDVTSFTVESVNGSAQFDVFYNGNVFNNRINIHAYFMVDEKKISFSHEVRARQSVNDKDFLSLTLNEPILEPNVESTVSVFTRNPVSASLHLLAIRRGKIFRSWKAAMHTDPSHLYSGVYQFELSLTATCSLAPSFFLVAYYVADDDVGVGDSVRLQVARCFEHKVSVNFSSNASRPGENVELSIKAAPNSHVSLTVVDKSVYLVPSLCAGSQMTAERVFLEMAKYDTSYQPLLSPPSGNIISDDEDLYEGSGGGSGMEPGTHLLWWKSWWSEINLPYLFKDPGISVITNVEFSKSSTVKYVKRQAGSGDADNQEEDGIAPLGRTRSYFPEVWLWEDHQADANGDVIVNVTVPDTITTWIADAFAVSASEGFGTTTEPSRLVAFKPFFVSLTLPYSVVRGEEVAIVATVFNYFYENLTVIIALDHRIAVGGFDFVGNSSKIQLFVQAQGSKTVRFPIIPKKLGQIPIKVAAYSFLESDALVKMLFVKPEGKEETYFASLLMTKNQTEKLSLVLPKQIVPGSFKGFLAISGDFLGPAINSLGRLLKMPYGCGEQNMINFAPAVLVKRYLLSVNLLTPEVDTKATRYMQIGYQRQLSYKRDDYSYAVWGQQSSFGSICLTTYVLRVYAQAASIMYIDRADMARTACWVMQMQEAGGSFREQGYCSHSYHSCVKDRDVVRTAYSLTTLIDVNNVTPILCSGNPVSISVVISRAVDYLKSRLAVLESDYSKAIVASALIAANEVETADVLLSKLEESVRVKGSKKHWSCGIPGSFRRCHGCPAPPASIEATAYVMLSYVRKGDVISALPIRNWLISQMNSNGGWRSTHDTVLALMALTLMSVKTGASDKPDLTVKLTSRDGVKEFFSINKNNRLITQQTEIPSPGIFRVTSSGTGAAIVQASVSYNVPEVPPESSFEIDVAVGNKWIEDTPTFNPTPTTAPTTDSYTTPTPSAPVLKIDDNGLELSTCLRWARREEESGMVVVEVGFLSGFDVEAGELKSLVHFNDVSLQRFEVDKNERKAVLYFNEVEPNRNICFNSSFRRLHCIANLQPAFIQAYSYYEPDYFTTVSYGPPATISNSLDKCQSPAEMVELQNEIEDGITNLPPSEPFEGLKGDSEAFVDAM